MSSWLKSLFKDSLVYGLGFGITKILQIIILPILTTVLTISEFGYYSNFVIFYTITSGLFLLGLDSSVARYYYDSEDISYHKKILFNAFLFIICLSVTGVAGFSFYKDQLLAVIGVPQEYKAVLPFVLFSIPAIALNNLFLGWFKWRRQKFYFLANSAGGVVFMLFPLLILPKITFLIIFQAYFYSQLLVVLLSVFFARNYLKSVPDAALLWALLKYGFPWMLIFALGISRSYLDRFFLTRFLDDDSYGIYNFSVRLATTLSLIITAFDMSFGPMAFGIWDKVGAPKFFARLQSGYVFLISAVATCIVIISPVLIKMLGGSKYIGAGEILPFLLFAAIPISLINFSNLGISYSKKSYLNTVSLLLGALAILFLNFILTPKFLEFGAVIASLVGHFVILILGYSFSHYKYKIPFNYIKDGLIFSLFLGLSISVGYFQLFNQTIDIVFKFISLFSVCLIISKLFFQIESRKINRYLKTKFPEVQKSLKFIN